jgi:hypothetical protein
MSEPWHWSVQKIGGERVSNFLINIVFLLLFFVITIEGSDVSAPEFNV